VRSWQIVDRGPPVPIYQLVEVPMCFLWVEKSLSSQNTTTFLPQIPTPAASLDFPLSCLRATANGHRWTEQRGF
jgi:hypothetical protein